MTEENNNHSIQIVATNSLNFNLEDFLKPSEKLRDNFNKNFYWCLPMVAANTLGWTLYNPFEFTVSWNGGPGLDSVIVECDQPNWVKSWFGFGTFTAIIPFLVRTSPGIDLWVRPVANYPRPAVLTLEGIVETDWLAASFTLNFMLLLPLVKIKFQVGDPLVQFVPYPRDFIENFDAQIISAADANEGELIEHTEWAKRRKDSLEKRQDPDLDYMRGLKSDGRIFEEHKKLFHPRKFKRIKPTQT